MRYIQQYPEANTCFTRSLGSTGPVCPPTTAPRATLTTAIPAPTRSTLTQAALVAAPTTQTASSSIASTALIPAPAAFYPPPTTPTAPTARPFHSQNLLDPVCSSCNKRGHSAADCWQTVLCGHCNKIGHNIHHCYQIIGTPPGLARQDRFYCEHCGRHGHTRDRCFDLYRCRVCSGRHPVESCYWADLGSYSGGRWRS